MLVGMGIVAGIGYLGILPIWSGSTTTDKPLVSIAKKATLSITVTERGSVESQVTVDGICELNGAQNKISYLIPEGSKVKKGEVVCKFDGAEIQKHIAEQQIKVKQAVARIETTQQEMEIQRNKGESDVIAAKVDLTLAQLDLEKYQKGDYPAEYTKGEGEMELKKKDVSAEAAKLEQYKALLKKGFKTSEDIRIQASMLAAKELDYKSSKQFLDVKKQYEYKRKSTEFSSKAEQNQKKVEQSLATAKAQVSKAAADYDAAKATADIEQTQLKEYLEQKDKTVMRAEQDGIVAYSNDRYWDASSQVREGATVYSRQKIFTLPDMTRMQLKVNIHESLIKKIKAGQKAEVRIDAFPNVVFVGDRQVGLATGRFDATLDERRRQGIHHGRYPERYQRLRAEARHDGRGPDSGQRAQERPGSARAGRRREQGRFLYLRRRTRRHQAQEGEGGREQREVGRDPRGAQGGRERCPRRPPARRRRVQER